MANQRNYGSDSVISRPLDGFLILEFAGLAPAPFAGLILADFGAQVIRVDRIEFKNKSGKEPPTIVSLDTLGMGGKKSIALDLKTQAGKEIIKKLYAKANAVIDPFRPGVLEALNIGPKVAAECNPQLVFCRLTGYGQTGPLKSAAGHDINYLALSGALNQFRQSPTSDTYEAGAHYGVDPGGTLPRPPVNLLADFAGGSLFAVMGILLGILVNMKTGARQNEVAFEGKNLQVIDVSMVDAVGYLATFLRGLQSRLGALSEQAPGHGILDGGAPFYRCYRCRDGKFVALGAIEPQFWRLFVEEVCGKFCQAGTEKVEFLKKCQNSIDDWPKVTEILSQIFASKDRDSFAEFTECLDCCVTPVLAFSEVGNHRHTKARGSLLADGNCQPQPRLSKTPGFRTNVGSLVMPGQHSLEILEGVAGLSKSEIQRLIADGVVVNEPRVVAKL